MPRVLLLATTTGYQTRAFGDAAERLGVDLLFATDRCNVLEDPWRDEALPIRFFDEAGAVSTIIEASRRRPIDGVVAVGDRPTAVAARVNEALGLPGHPLEAVTAARNKRATRQRFKAAGLPVPAFVEGTAAGDLQRFMRGVGFPAVVKPLALSGSRGVIRIDDEASLVAALYRLRSLLAAPDIRAERDDSHDLVLVEEFIEGREFAIEGLMNHGALDVLAIFDKPDPLDGPFFEETIYLTPSNTSPSTQQTIITAVRGAIAALGLYHGPIHAECRVNARGAFVLEVAARPIGGLCARALRFRRERQPATAEDEQGTLAEPTRGDVAKTFSFEELLLRHALGERSTGWRREELASGVMMIPIPRRGLFRSVSGLNEARAVPGVEDIRITAKVDQLLIPLPEGASYLGFIFSRAALAADVDRVLREAHAHLTFTIVPEYGCYNPGMADSCAPTPSSRPGTNKTGRKVFCVKFQKELPGLDAPPWPGELGQRIFDGVSVDAWKLWEERMKMILNEYRLMPWQKEAQDLVAKHMEDFFFGEGSALPPDYVPQQAK